MAVAYERLSDEEKYLATILMDPSGVDQAEFVWKAPENRDNCFRLWPMQWCFAAGTDVVTHDGIRQIEDVVGPVRLLTEDGPASGKWVDAEVRSFGSQRIWEVELQRDGVTKVIRTTAGHRWFAGGGRRRDRAYLEVTTNGLRSGMYLRSCFPRKSHGLKITPWGVAHGIVWGDGTREKNNSCHVDLWGEKLELTKYMFGDGQELHRDDVSVSGRTWSLLPSSMKSLPSLDESPSYLYSWLAGYVATDGSVNPDGTCQIESTNVEGLKFVQAVCLRLGVVVGELTRFTRKNAMSGSTVVFRVTIKAGDLPQEFFLRSSHRAKHGNLGRVYRPREWRVLAVRETSDVEEVFCAVVPRTHSFVLAGYILTGNCWWRCTDPLQEDFSARAVGKTQGIKARLFAFPFVHPNEEAMITAPELIHLEPITQLVEEQFYSTRLGSEMINGRATHRPFMLKFNNGARILGRIPQRDGKGLKGSHPTWLEMDESQDMPEPAWREVIETLNKARSGHCWRAHGVTRGIGDTFDKNARHAAQEHPLRPRNHASENLFTVHKIPSMARPTWTDEERQQKIQIYGSKDDADYRRNVLGAPGDSQSPIFVLHRLLKCCDDDPSSEYNTDEYWHVTIRDSELAASGLSVEDFLIPPASHRDYKTVWMGADIGIVSDPTEILIAAEYPLKEEEKKKQASGKAIPQEGANRLKIIGRVTLIRLGEPEQVDAIMTLVDLYSPKVFAMDRTGLGLPLFQNIQRRMNDLADATKSRKAREAAESIKGYNFSEKILVEIDETEDFDEDATIQEKAAEAGLKRNVLEMSTDLCRSYVDRQVLWIPWDIEFIRELSGQTFSYSKSKIDGYGRGRVFSKGSFHAFDALRMLVLGHKQYAIEALLATKEEKGPVFDQFIPAYSIGYSDVTAAVW